MWIRGQVQRAVPQKYCRGNKAWKFRFYSRLAAKPSPMAAGEFAHPPFPHRSGWLSG